MEDDRLIVGVDDLVRNFRSALISLVPAVERVRMTWADVMNQHYAWERLQSCLFDAFVAQPVRVDFDRIDGEFAFVRFVTRADPFDVVQGVAVDAVTHLTKGRSENPLADVEFFYLLRTAEGRTDRVSVIQAVE